jgi:cation diffusion facilitator CzcD-associated flavoprotein CzcO
MTAHEPTAELDFAVPMDATELLKENARRFAIERPVRPRNFEAWLRLPESAAPLPRTDSQLPVLVVGAGPAGLAAMAELRRADVNCEGIEFHSQVGGIWDQSNPLSSVYDSLTTNTSRYTTHLGPPMPREWPDYPHHRQAHGYLERFAAEAGILPHIRFLTSFEGAVKSDRQTWIAALRSVGEHKSDAREYRAIVVATGLHNKKNRLFPEHLRSQAAAAGLDVIHSSDYRHPGRYVGKRVLVVGLGVSGTDIANEVSRVAARTMLSFRSVPWIVPLNVFGRPGDQAAQSPMARLPFRVQRECFRVIRSMTIGNPRRLGLPAPSDQLWDRFALSDRGIVEALKTNRVVACPSVAALEDGVAIFGDDRRPEPIDAVVFATGYERKYPLLEDRALGGKSLCESLPFLIFHPTDPSLAYLSEVISPCGCWSIFLEQGRAIAAFFAAEQRGERAATEFNARRLLPSPDVKGGWYRKADGFHVDVGSYLRTLRKLAAWLSDSQPTARRRDTLYQGAPPGHS